MTMIPLDPQAFAGQHWSIAIFSSREDPARLSAAVLAAANADRGAASLAIDLLINGNSTLAFELRSRLSTSMWWKSGATIRLWSVPQPDKAHTWNQYLHVLAPVADIAFFMDGYVTVEPDAFAEMAEALQRRPTALAATCLPTTGRSAQEIRRRMLAEGGLHGNLYALTGATMQRLRREGFRLPRGIYRNDSALGAALAFDLDPARNIWSWDRIAVVPDALYETPVADPTRLGDLRTLLKRRLRQGQGQLETRALKAHLAGAKRSPMTWPSTAQRLVLQWAEEHPDEAQSLLWRDPIAWSALVKLRRQRNEAESGEGIECLGQYSRATASPRRAPALMATGR